MWCFDDDDLSLGHPRIAQPYSPITSPWTASVAISFMALVAFLLGGLVGTGLDPEPCRWTITNVQEDEK